MITRNSSLPLYALIATLFTTFSGVAQPQTATSTVTQPQTGVTMIRSDDGAFGGSSMGTTHQNTADYQIEKTLHIPGEALRGVEQARLRVYMTLRDNSRAGNTPPNGMDEAFELLVNSKTFLYQTNDPALPAVGNAAPRWQWHDFAIPVGNLKPGANTFAFRKTPSDKNDDFLYIGIDSSSAHGHSRASLDGGKTWSQTSLNAIGASGEYMIRLLLLKETPRSQATWTPQQTTDPQKLIGYSEGNGSKRVFELDSYRFDAAQPFQVEVDYRGTPPTLHWFNETGAPVAVNNTVHNGTLRSELPQQQSPPVRLEIVAPDGKAVDIAQVHFDYSRPVGDVAQRVDMAPQVLPARGKPQARTPQASLGENGFTLQNSTLVARFETRPHLRLVALHNEYLQKNILAHPEATKLFLVEVGDKRYSAGDWQVKNVRQLAPAQVAVQLALPAAALEAQLTLGVDEQNLRFGLQITNAGRTAQSWKTAFPHLGGIQLSPTESEDYYLFPIWGGAVANANVNLKTIYGDESAWWQMIDIFSPGGGAGVSLRNLDETGLYKGIAMRKGVGTVPGGSLLRDYRSPTSGGYMAPDMGFQNTLDAAPGVTATFEYLKYTREPGGSFSPPDVALKMHAGDWQTAMQEYADWAHRVWKWQPGPNRLRGIWNTLSTGTPQNPLYQKDGTWRTDLGITHVDAAELWSWWRWSKKGPWQVPMDRLEEELGSSLYQGYKNYWAMNPATGQMEYGLNRGDYEYNTEWGGLPALRKYLQDLRAKGIMPMFYTDPVLADDNTRLGNQHGPQYGVMNPLWKNSNYGSEKKTPPGYVGSYAGYNMCLDNKWYQDFVVQQAARIVRDTGVDAIRFDEFGHRGFVCHNPRHKHIFAEPGHNAWMQAATEITRRTQEEAKKIDPDFVLMGEFPGHDRLAATLDGSINYESAQHVFAAFRPVPLNIFRFYFPQHKQYDLDTTQRAFGREWRFWNASGAGLARVGQHPPLYHRILKENSDAFDSREVTALAPSLAQGVYANRFAGGGKTITLLYNARGFTVDEPLLAVPVKAGYHYFDLLNGKEIAPQNNAIALKLRAADVAAIAQLPKVLTVSKNGTNHTIRLARTVNNAKLILCTADGTPLETKELSGQELTVSNSQATYVKLVQGRYLLDATTLS